MVSVTRSAGLAALPVFSLVGVLFTPVAASAASTSISASPSGDISTGIDWNVSNPSGGALFRNGFAAGALRGFSSFVLGTQQGGALTSASVGDLTAGVHKEVTRTANQSGVNNTTTLPAGADASFSDRITFSGVGAGVSFTLTPNVGLGTSDRGFDFGEGAPEFVSFEENFNQIEAEIVLTYTVKNANNSTAYTITQGAYERFDANGLFTSRGRFADFTYQDIAPIDFTLSAGQTLLISGTAYAYVNVFSSVAVGPGAADAYASVELSLDGLTPGWSYATDSGGTLPVSAIPEPSAVAALCGLAALGVVVRRRRRA